MEHLKELNMLRKQVEKLSTLDKDNLNGWKSSSKQIIARIFGSEHLAIHEIEKIYYRSGGVSGPGESYYWDNLNECSNHGRYILMSCIDEILNFGIKDVNNENYIKSENQNLTVQFNNQQSQYQNQTNQINLETLFENHLSEKQFKEIKEIFKSNEKDNIKKDKILKKLMSFGENVVAGILANLLILLFKDSR